MFGKVNGYMVDKTIYSQVNKAFRRAGKAAVLGQATKVKLIYIKFNRFKKIAELISAEEIEEHKAGKIQLADWNGSPKSPAQLTELLDEYMQEQNRWLQWLEDRTKKDYGIFAKAVAGITAGMVIFGGAAVFASQKFIMQSNMLGGALVALGGIFAGATGILYFLCNIPSLIIKPSKKDIWREMMDSEEGNLGLPPMMFTKEGKAQVLEKMENIEKM